MGNIFTGIQDVATSVKAHTGVNGVARAVPLESSVSSVKAVPAVGDLVDLGIYSAPTKFRVVQIGNPDPTLYGSDFDDAVVVLREYCPIYDNAWAKPWGSSNDYANSTMHKTTLFVDIFNSLDPLVQSNICPVRIPYRYGSGTGSTIRSLSNGLLADIWLLSNKEVGYAIGGNYIVNDGAVFEYFKGELPNGASEKRTYYSEEDSHTHTQFWALRTPYRSNAVAVTSASGGNLSQFNATQITYIRPAFALPKSFFFL